MGPRRLGTRERRLRARAGAARPGDTHRLPTGAVPGAHSPSEGVGREWGGATGTVADRGGAPRAGAGLQGQGAGPVTGETLWGVGGRARGPQAHRNRGVGDERVRPARWSTPGHRLPLGKGGRCRWGPKATAVRHEEPSPDDTVQHRPSNTAPPSQVDSSVSSF